MASKSSTTTDSERLHDPHAGELPWSEFMEPLDLDAAMLATAIATGPDRSEALIGVTSRIDGDLDMRLSRYFRMS